MRWNLFRDGLGSIWERHLKPALWFAVDSKFRMRSSFDANSVVEDDSVLADGLKIGLGFHGATLDVVASCADGQAGLAIDEFDAVALDLMLSDGSSLNPLTSLRAKGDRIPLLLLTALDEVPDRINGLDAGADDYLGKPIDLNEQHVSARSAAGGGPRIVLRVLQIVLRMPRNDAGR